MLYALAIGFGRDPLDPAELPFIYERGLKVAPSFATVAAWGSNPPILRAGIDYRRLVHAAQAVVVHHPLPAAARVRAEGGIVGAIDKGDKGALIEGEARLRDATTGVAYVTNRVTWLARADGHFGGPRTGEAPAHCMPARAPDITIRQATRPDQAALYRLLGDRNPLHIDPAVAAAAGFDRPILHGSMHLRDRLPRRAASLRRIGADAHRQYRHAFFGPGVAGRRSHGRPVARWCDRLVRGCGARPRSNRGPPRLRGAAVSRGLRLSTPLVGFSA